MRQAHLIAPDRTSVRGGGAPEASGSYLVGQRLSLLRTFLSFCSSRQAQAWKFRAPEQAGAAASAGEPCDLLLAKTLWIQTGYGSFRNPSQGPASGRSPSPPRHLLCCLGPCVCCHKGQRQTQRRRDSVEHGYAGCVKSGLRYTGVTRHVYRTMYCCPSSNNPGF